MSRLSKEPDEANNAGHTPIIQAQAERKKATLIAIIVFILFVIVGSLYAMPSKGVRQKSELIFTTVWVVVVGLGLAISVKVSLNKQAKQRLDEDLKTSQSKSSS